MKDTDTYTIIDSGNFEKLEKIGPYTYIRPALQAVWSKSSPKLWNKYDVIFKRNSTGSGKWIYKKDVPESFFINFNDLKIKIKNTGFGHIGLFPEQQENSKWFSQIIQKSKKPLKVLNLFAYTGVSSLKLLQAGAEVTHVDAAPGVVSWAKDNLNLSKISNDNIRWIVDDVSAFIARESRRKNFYDAVIMDPPTFGRGPKKELWKIDEHLIKLLQNLKKLFSPNFKFFLLTGHTPNYTPIALKNIAKEIIPDGGCFSSGEMLIKDLSDKNLPSGSYLRWEKK